MNGDSSRAGSAVAAISDIRPVQLLEDDTDLAPGEVRAQAEVRAAAAEPGVGVGLRPT